MIVHNGARMVIARRSYSLKEKVSKILKDKLITYLDKFNKKNARSRWNGINKNIKGKVGENPDLWFYKSGYRMELRVLRYFLTVAREGNITKAAKMLFKHDKQ